MNSADWLPNNADLAMMLWSISVALLFIDHRRDLDIVKELSLRNIAISDREVAFLGKKFIVYLALAHAEARDRIKQSMDRRGGYILHLDGTCDGDSPTLVSGLDGISQIVLNNIKIPTEKSDHLIPFLETIKQDYGEPLAMVHDMGRGIQKAVDKVFPGIPDYICHFHFLRDIGKDLLDGDYKMIRLCLKNSRVRGELRKRARSLSNKIEIEPAAIAELKASLESGEVSRKFGSKMPAITAFALIHWVLDADSESNGYGFPFDRPHLVLSQRLRKALEILGKIKHQHLTKDGLSENLKANAPLVRLYDLISGILHNKHLHLAIRNLEIKAEVFDQLRLAMRIGLPEEKSGLNDDGGEIEMKSIETKLTEFKTWMASKEFPYDQLQYSGLLTQLEKYWPKLLAEPITMQTIEGPVTIYPQRTNNDMERLFRDLKRGHRRKTGTSQMNRALRAILADTPLVRNLRNEEYQSLVLNGHSTLAERFADIDAHLARKKLEEAQRENQRLPKGLTQIIRRDQLSNEILKMFIGQRFKEHEKNKTQRQ